MYFLNFRYKNPHKKCAKSKLCRYFLAAPTNCNFPNVVSNTSSAKLNTSNFKKKKKAKFNSFDPTFKNFFYPQAHVAKVTFLAVYSTSDSISYYLRNLTILWHPVYYTKRCIKKFPIDLQCFVCVCVNDLPPIDKESSLLLSFSHAESVSKSFTLANHNPRTVIWHNNNNKR